MPHLGLSNLIKTTWHPHFLQAVYSCRKWAALCHDTEEINRPTKQIRVPSLRLQKQLPENPFIHIQLPILLMTLLMTTLYWLAELPTPLSILFIFDFFFFFFLGQNERKCFDRNCLLSLQSKSVIKAAVKQQNVRYFRTGQSIVHLFTQTTSSKCQNQENTVSSLTVLVMERRLSPFHKNDKKYFAPHEHEPQRHIWGPVRFAFVSAILDKEQMRINLVSD